ncbi:MAG: TIGR03560 family F420-dependent LLM class oxidoreductase [Anaerolineales bacterium]|nr:TIGR03560 family F420-dependent LLM class oxidoreductase [Anaerolineales bacterium]
MLEIAIMIEGQNGLTWPRWQRLAAAVEELGFVGLYRSDHFTNATPPDKESLELWVSLTWLASHTKRIEFGSLVSPLSFRHPAFTARVAAAVDDLSDAGGGGRLTLGLGAGWQEREHHLFGFDLLDMKSRFARFEEGLEVITRLLKSDAPVTSEGKYYQLRGATLLPRPARRGGPPILIGGNGEKRTLPLVAKYADEWNAIFLQPDDFKRLNARLDDLLKQNGRAPESVRRSMMTGLKFGRTKKELKEKLAAKNQKADDLRRKGLIVGVGEEIVPQLTALEEAGLQRIMLQWLDLDDLAGLEALAKAVL